MITVLKLGGELLEDAGAVRSAAEAIVRLAATAPLVVVHGGGRAIDAELRARGESPRFVDGLRITDQAALDTVVSVLAGRTNTTLVAAIGAAGGRAVGLTGADGRIGLSRRAAPLHTVSGEVADLGLVGEPAGSDVSLLTDLVRLGCIPVVASIGVDPDGVLLNVNADVLAAHLAANVPAERLIIAGGTAGVLDANGPDDGRPRRGRHRRDDDVRSGAFGNGGKARGLPSRLRERCDRYLDCGGPGRGRLHDRVR